jgi:sulfonate transport system substrate-binding protein
MSRGGPGMPRQRASAGRPDPMLGLILLLQALTVAVSGPATSPEYLPLWVAEAEGLFTREGLSVTLRSTRAEVGAAEALAQSQVDLAATSLEALLRFGTRPTVPAPRLVFGLTAAPPVVLLGSARPGEPSSVDKLAGSRVGLSAPGAPEHTWLLGILAVAKVNPAHVQFVSLGARALPSALDGAEIQAGMVSEPTATRMLADGKGVMLADLRTPESVASAFGALTVSAAVFTRRERRVSDGDLTAFARALLAAEERIRSGSSQSLAERLSARIVGSPEEFDARLAATRGIYLPEGRVTPAQLRRTIEMILAHLPLPASVTLPRPEDMLYLEPLHRALTPSR